MTTENITKSPFEANTDPRLAAIFAGPPVTVDEAVSALRNLVASIETSCDTAEDQINVDDRDRQMILEDLLTDIRLAAQVAMVRDAPAANLAPSVDHPPVGAWVRIEAPGYPFHGIQGYLTAYTSKFMVAVRDESGTFEVTFQDTPCSGHTVVLADQEDTEDYVPTGDADKLLSDAPF